MLSTKFQEALGKGGLKTALISLLLYVVLFVVNMVVVGGTVIALISNGLDGRLGALGGSAIVLLLMALLNLLCGILFAAGQLGSFKDVVEGREVSFSAYWTNSKNYFLRYLGYGIVFGVLVGILGAILVGAPMVASGGPGGFWSGLGQLAFTLVVNVYLFPQLCLLIARYERKGFVGKNILPLFVYSLVSGICGLIPLLGPLLSAIMQIFYSLFVFVIYQEQQNSNTSGEATPGKSV